jgi:dihydroorotate dehydrogenase electron transfer subunit
MKRPDGLYKAFRLQEITQENYRTRSLHFDGPLSGAQPGQFVMVWLPEVGERPYSISGSDPFTLTVVAVGEFSEHMCRLTPGERVWVRGPLGAGYALKGKQHLLAGGGYGSAPLLFLAREARQRGDIVHVCLGARTAEEVLLTDAFTAIGCHLHINTDDGSLGSQGLVTQAVSQVLDTQTIDTLYGCGPLPMLSALAHICREARLPHQLSWEALMRCGIGLCGSCELPEAVCRNAGIPTGWLACMDGPVFEHLPQ